MLFSIFKTIVQWVLAFTLLMLFILIPREMEIEYGPSGEFITGHYHYSISLHGDNIKQFFEPLFNGEGLGYDRYDQPLLTHAWDMMQRSLLLVIPAFFLSIFLGVAKGVFDFQTRHGKRKVIGLQTTWLGLSVPDLFYIIMIQMGLMYLNVKGIITGLSLYGAGSPEAVIMNIIYLSIFPLFYIANVTFSALSDQHGAEYIKTARAKGVSPFKLLYIHMLRNGLAKLFIHTNIIVLYLLSNLFVIEFLTQYRGAAYYFKEYVSVVNHIVDAQSLSVNTAAIAAYTFFFTVIILIAGVISQIARGLLLPHERGEKG
ncbi:ABC transporter permease subunit [Jeotgalibacillus haloalkalitolerans]|uniref:ABC transporter permease subunit n=1 Tax=Jeotgalibacillus haloalkalitolerans TaxID=3104292 RepID=A0ABU5KPK0_9BACL|nr:ABC transporter permease subunit [Jeotgalibacillus sp. HH7-29]MDZ5713184.1 ABC transporter permease subunit [Jeotgalibacillus sp. HH7-29]